MSETLINLPDSWSDDLRYNGQAQSGCLPDPRAKYMHNHPTVTSSLPEWLSYLEHLHRQPIELGLERIQKVASHLNLLTPAPVVFTVAGTNGKGTTCCTLEAILLAAGLRVGVYSSPHLIRYTERVRIQGEELSETAHCQALAYIDAGRGSTSLTYFEFGTLSALHLFQQAQLDVVILEVGLGGRLDATNIVDADVAVITSIALDHTDWLGDSRESIGREKAGIFRCGRPAIVGESDIPVSVIEVAHESGAMLYACNEAWSVQLAETTWNWQCADEQWSHLPYPQVPLANASTALAALHYSPLEISLDAIRQGLAQAALPGRFQIAGQNPLVILDVAHNPHAAAYLASRLSQLDHTGHIHAVVGMLGDKDMEGTLACLQPLVTHWYCASLEGPRAATADQLASYLAQEQITAETFSSVPLAWHAAMNKARENDIVLVFGSFHTVAPVMEVLDAEKQCGQ